MTELRLRIHADHAPGAWRLALVSADEPQRVVATLLAHDQVGLREPRHWFHLGSALHASAELKLFRLQGTLLLGSDLAGAAELAELRAEGGHADAPRLLVEGALAWLAMRRTRAEREGTEPPGARVFAELPGLRDTAGHAPFWQGLGQHCLTMSPAQAERRFGATWVRGLAPLLPRQPVMTALLSDTAQQALSRHADEAQPWADALATNGLHAGQHATVFDGGPVHEGNVDTAARTGRWCQMQALAQTPTGHCWLAVDGDFSLRRVAGRIEGDMLVLAVGDQQRLGCAEHARVWAAPSSPA